MIRGLLRKILLETWAQSLAFCLAICIVGALLTMLMPHLEQGANQVLAMLPFARNILQALLGQAVGETLDPSTVQAIIWVHPVVLVLLWAHEIIYCTRMPAGEIDRGTVDILLSWPISRRKLFCVESTVWILTGLMMIAMLLLGHLLGRQVSSSQAPHSWRNVFIVAANLYCVYVAVGAGAWLVSAWSDRRGRAVMVVFSFVLASFLLNFLVQVWPRFAALSWLGVLNYYRPAKILATGDIPTTDLLALCASGVFCWLFALGVFKRRSICTI